jgi:hypothetical protein
MTLTSPRARPNVCVRRSPCRDKLSASAVELGPCIAHDQGRWPNLFARRGGGRSFGSCSVAPDELKNARPYLRPHGKDPSVGKYPHVVAFSNLGRAMQGRLNQCRITVSSSSP